MEYEVHGRKIEWDEFRELGFCFGLEKGVVDMRYFVSYADRIVKIANNISKQEALDEATKMHERALEHLEHPTLEKLPNYKQGTRNSKNFYKILIDILKD